MEDKNSTYFFDFKQKFVEVEPGVKEQTICNGDGMHVVSIQVIGTGTLRLYSAINRNGKMIARGDYDFVAGKIRDERGHLVEVAQMTERMNRLKQAKTKNELEREGPELTR